MLVMVMFVSDTSIVTVISSEMSIGISKSLPSIANSAFCAHSIESWFDGLGVGLIVWVDVGFVVVGCSEGLDVGDEVFDDGEVVGVATAKYEMDGRKSDAYKYLLDQQMDSVSDQSLDFQRESKLDLLLDSLWVQWLVQERD